MSKIDPTIAGWHVTFHRPSTGDRYMITVGLTDHDAAVDMAINASPHVDEDEVLRTVPVTAGMLERHGVPPGGWQQTV